MCCRSDIVERICYLNTVTPSTLKSNVFNIKRYKHLVNVEEDCVDNGDQTCFSQSELGSLTNGDPVIEKKLKILLLEAEVLRQSGGRVPDKIDVEQWKELLELPTRSRRRKFMAYLFGVEKRKENKKLKKEKSRLLREENKPLPQEDENGHIIYALGRNSMFIRIYDATITKFENSRLIQAMQFGQKLVLDCSYDSYMSKQEAQNCGKQMMLMFSDNRAHDKPYDLHFCNVNKESLAFKQLLKYIPILCEPDFPLNLTEKSYLDIFPKENLVYLTPHCREVLREFDHEAVYIIGAIVDKANGEPLSLAKAKREGLKMAKLPIDEHLLWGTGSSKSLTLNQMMRIMLEIRDTNDWNKALLHVPRRKVLSDPNGNNIQRSHFVRKNW